MVVDWGKDRGQGSEVRSLKSGVGSPMSEVGRMIRMNDSLSKFQKKGDLLIVPLFLQLFRC